MFWQAHRDTSRKALVTPRKSKRTSAAAPLRKEPTQERGRARLRLILDAAEKEFADEGYERVTMEEVARKSKSSIGSVYRFFPDKRALFNAVAKRYEEQARAHFSRIVAGASPDMSINELVDLALDGIWAFNEKSNGLRAVWLNGQWSNELLELAGAMNEESAGLIASLFGVRAPNLAPARRKVIARFVVDLVSCLLFVAARSPKSAPSVIAETKAAVKAYLASVL